MIGKRKVADTEARPRCTPEDDLESGDSNWLNVTKDDEASTNIAELP